MCVNNVFRLPQNVFIIFCFIIVHYNVISSNIYKYIIFYINI